MLMSVKLTGTLTLYWLYFTGGQCAKGTSRCSASTTELKKEATVTCLFPADVSLSETFFKIYHDEEKVADCLWMQKRTVCGLKHGYQQDDQIATKSFTLRIPHFLQNHTGPYSCDVTGYDKEECTLSQSTDAGIKTGEVKSYESKSDLPLTSDHRVVVIISAASCVCLVVMSVVVTTGVVCYQRARTQYDRPQSGAEMNVAFAHLNDALQGANSSRDHARDIYEEIPDPPKKNRRSRVGSTASSKTGVKLPPVPVEQQHEEATTQNPTKQAEPSGNFDGYLHPMVFSHETRKISETS